MEDEDVFVADGFTDCDGSFLVGVLEDHDFGELDAESLRHQTGQLRVTVPSQQLDTIRRHFVKKFDRRNENPFILRPPRCGVKINRVLSEEKDPLRTMLAR